MDRNHHVYPPVKKSIYPSVPPKHFFCRKDAKICSIDSEKPNHFFINLVSDDEFNFTLKQLQFEMNILYKDSTFPLKYIEKGVICVCKVDNEFKRVEIVKTGLNNGMSHVQMLDYGGQRIVPTAGLMPLKMKFASDRLKWQAYYCMFAHTALVEAPGIKTQVMEYICKETLHETVYVQNIATCGRLHAVKLYKYVRDMVSGSVVKVNIGDELIRMGLAYSTQSMFGTEFTDSWVNATFSPMGIPNI